MADVVEVCCCWCDDGIELLFWPTAVSIWPVLDAYLFQSSVLWPYPLSSVLFPPFFGLRCFWGMFFFFSSNAFSIEAINSTPVVPCDAIVCGSGSSIQSPAACSLARFVFPLPPPSAEGDGGRGQRVHRGRDRQAHRLATRGHDGDEGRPRGKGKSALRPALALTWLDIDVKAGIGLRHASSSVACAPWARVSFAVLHRSACVRVGGDSFGRHAR